MLQPRFCGRIVGRPSVARTMRNRINEEITFRKLEVLLAFMEAGSLAKAAEALGVSTVSVHRALHTLEEGMHCALFRHEGGT